MKVTIDIEATAQEMREFLGLPNVQPLQDEVLSQMRENLKKGVSFDPSLLLQPMQSVEAMQKLFWEAFTRSGADKSDKGGKGG